MLRPDGGIIETRRNGVRTGNLAVTILQHVRISSLQNARRSAAKAGSMVAETLAAAACLYPDEPHALIPDELMEYADCIRTAAYTGYDGRGQLAFRLQDLRPRLPSDDRVEIAHHGRIRMRPKHAAQEVMRVADVGHPVAHGFIDGIFERARSGIHAPYLSAQQAHAEDVEFLAAHILYTHVNHALETEKRADR